MAEINLSKEIINKIKQKIGYQATFNVKDIFSAIDFAFQNNFKAVELNLSIPTFYPEKYKNKEREKIAKYSREKGITILLHAPEETSLFSFIDDVRKNSIKILKRVINFGYDIGAKVITFHLGFGIPISSNGEMVYINKLFPDQFMSNLSESLNILLNYSKGKIDLSLENVGNFGEPETKEIIQTFLENENLFLTWDLGHNNLKHKAHQKQDEFFMKYLNKIKCCHLHDNHGNRDEHLPIGEGEIDFNYYLPMLANLDAYLVFEVRPKELALICKKNLNL
ncbi:MAG: sugar phosphate isomerase/epimerase [Actinomycetota bacterium]